ncbi:MAG: hypothetical protein ACREA0_03445 [bacterium]
MRGHIAKKGKTYYAVVYEGIKRYTHKLWMTGCWLGRDVPS